MRPTSCRTSTGWQTHMHTLSLCATACGSAAAPHLDHTAAAAADAVVLLQVVRNRAACRHTRAGVTASHHTAGAGAAGANQPRARLPAACLPRVQLTRQQHLCHHAFGQASALPDPTARAEGAAVLSRLMLLHDSTARVVGSAVLKRLSCCCPGGVCRWTGS